MNEFWTGLLYEAGGQFTPLLEAIYFNTLKYYRTFNWATGNPFENF